MFERVIASIWAGNRTIASAHYDMSNNLACCVVGHRRFTCSRPRRSPISIPAARADPGGRW
jgi:hypothetical protein